MKNHKLLVIYILCSSYDDDGYPRRFLRGVFPSNTLGCLRSLTENLDDSGLLPPGTSVEVRTYDDTLEKIPVRKIAAQAGPDTTVVVGLAGVQTGQFTRATHLATQFREHNLPVLVGGFHVSGSLAMLGKPTAELQHLIDQGVSLIRGEAESPEAFAEIFRDILEGKPQPIYTMPTAPAIGGAPLPRVPEQYRKRFFSGTLAPLDTSRGCPFNCSFCTVINVLGHKMRHRNTTSILAAVEQGYNEGVRTYFFVDDNMARSPIWEEIFDGLIEMRTRGIEISFLMQVDTLAYKIPNFVEKAAKAGCSSVFIGMESIDPVNLKAVGKKQNRVHDYAHMVDTWRDQGMIIHVGYITGLPNDNPENIASAVETLSEVVGIDQVSFFKLTPLPGSADHRDMVHNGTILDSDLNNYDSLHTTFQHPKMTGAQWDDAYRKAWERFYSPENITRILLRAPKRAYWSLFWMLVWYRFSMLSGEHPMFSGYVRFKERSERRPDRERESRLQFFARRVADAWRGTRRTIQLYLEFQEIWMLTRKRDDPTRWTIAELRWKLSSATAQVDAAVDPVITATREKLQTMSRAVGREQRRSRARLLRAVRSLRDYSRSLPTTADAHALRDRALRACESVFARDLSLRARLTTQWRQLALEMRHGLPSLRRLAWTPVAAALELALSLRFAVAFIRKPSVPSA